MWVTGVAVLIITCLTAAAATWAGRQTGPAELHGLGRWRDVPVVYTCPPSHAPCPNCTLKNKYNRMYYLRFIVGATGLMQTVERLQHFNHIFSLLSEQVCVTWKQITSLQTNRWWVLTDVMRRSSGDNWTEMFDACCKAAVGWFQMKLTVHSF